MSSIQLVVLLTVLLVLAHAALPARAQGNAEGVTLRFYQAATAYIANPDGVKFDVTLDVREWNLLENGPRELLVKVYDPDGRVLVRKLVEDDGITGEAFMPETGGWDHEMWYYLLQYSRGSAPMIRWSSFTDPARLAALQKRTFTFPVGGKKGIYRVLLAGSRDHVATLRISKGLKFGLSGHPNWMHGHGDMFKRSYVYIPKGTGGIELGFAEYDQPVTRTFTVTAPDGAILWQGPAKGGFQSRSIPLDPTGKYDDQLLRVDVSDGKGDYMMYIQFTRNDVLYYRGTPGVPAIYAPDEATAKALQGGAIYHDGKIFWHGVQVRLYDWMKQNLKPEDFVVHDAAGKVIPPADGPKSKYGKASVVFKGLPELPGFIPLNGPHESPPMCDTMMHNYPAHHDRGVLNYAIRDLADGLNWITVGDTPYVAGWNGNMGYVFGTYFYHYWRPAWRILQQSDAPPEAKALIKEAIIMCGDRLAMSAGIERTNGNAMSHIPMALRYAAEGAKDPLLTKLADTYFERFISEGWGRGTGISKSGDCQEHFAHDFHYGSYIDANFTALVNDLGDTRFEAVLTRLRELYTYMYCADTNAFPWGSRTSYPASLGAYGWKGKPGPSFTVSVNGGDEWFAARRQTYYALTFHGRLAPEWLDNYFATRIGYGGGVLCQLTVPGFGTVLASTLNGSYGEGMQRENWQNFHINSIVGTMANGKPLVAADSEHLNAKLQGTTVTGSGEVRDRPLRSARSYTFNNNTIACSVQLADTDYRAALWGQGEAAVVTEAYEMIPFVNPKVRNVGQTTVQTISPDGKTLETLGAQLTPAGGVVIDRKGYGVKIIFEQERLVKLGNNDTVLVLLTDTRTDATKIGINYTLMPYIGEATAGATGARKEPRKLANLPGLTTPEAVARALATQPAYPEKANAVSLGKVRFAVSGNALAVLATVTDAKLTRPATVWQGSCFEVYGAMPKSEKISQLFLAPTVGDTAAAGFRATKNGIVPAPDIRVASTTTATGYTIAALIPLSLLGIDPATDIIRLECQIDANTDKGAMVYGTFFGTKYAYESNYLFADFQVEK